MPARRAGRHRPRSAPPTACRPAGRRGAALAASRQYPWFGSVGALRSAVLAAGRALRPVTVAAGALLCLLIRSIGRLVLWHGPRRRGFALLTYTQHRATGALAWAPPPGLCSAYLYAASGDSCSGMGPAAGA